MAATVYKSGTTPWRQGGRTIETFRGGLLKVTDTYLTPFTDLSASLLTLAEGSAIPDIYQSFDFNQAWIFPTPQWRDNGDGFALISVTAYARTTDSAVTEESMGESQLVTTTTTDDVVTSTVSETILSSVFTVKFTSPTSDGFTIPDAVINLEPSVFSTSGGTDIDYDAATKSINVASVTNYGYVTEIILTVSFSFTKSIIITTT